MWGSTISHGVTRGERVLHAPRVTAAAPQGVWVVIVNYNTAHLLERCLTALRASTLDRPCTVFVVDNGSHDGSVALVRERFPEAVLLETGANVGFARANNVALRRVLALVPDRARRAHAVLLLNSDCFVEPETIQRLVTVLEREPDVAIVGPKLVLPDGRLDLACRRSFPTPGTALWKLTGLARLFPRSRWFARYNLTYRDPDEPLEVDAVSGACMLVRLQAVVEAGLLDEAFSCTVRISTGRIGSSSVAGACATSRRHEPSMSRVARGGDATRGFCGSSTGRWHCSIVATTRLTSRFCFAGWCTLGSGCGSVSRWWGLLCGGSSVNARGQSSAWSTSSRVRSSAQASSSRSRTAWESITSSSSTRTTR